MGKIGLGIILLIVSVIVLLLTISLERSKSSKNEENRTRKDGGFYTNVVIIDGLIFFILFFGLGLLLLFGFFD